MARRVRSLAGIRRWVCDSFAPCALLALGLILLAAGAVVCDAAPTIAVRAQRVLLPLISEGDLDSGWVESDPARGAFALEVEVNASSKDRSPWALWIRADGPGFGPEGSDKPCSDLMWKLDEAPASSYARLEEGGALVLRAPEGGSLRVAIDVRVRVDWSTGSGPLALGVYFDVAPD